MNCSELLRCRNKFGMTESPFDKGEGGAASLPPSPPPYHHEAMVSCRTCFGISTNTKTTKQTSY